MNAGRRMNTVNTKAESGKRGHMMRTGTEKKRKAGQKTADKKAETGAQRNALRKRGGKQLFRFLTGAGILFSVLAWRGAGAGSAYAQEQKRQPESWKRYSEIYDSLDRILDPPEEFTDEKGESYRLISRRIEEIPVTGRKERLSGQVVYREVSRDTAVPGTARMEVQDEESGQSFEAELPFEKAVYERERWKGDFAFTVTFHTYGADYYRLGEMKVPHDSDRPPLEMCRSELLAVIGVREEDVRMEEIDWDGEVYTDENGVQCRDARVTGTRRVWDCRAVYSGEIMLPDYKKYRLLAEYERTEPRSETIQSPSEALREIPPKAPLAFSAAEYAGSNVPVWMKWLRRTIAASFSLIMIAAAIWGFKRLLALASRLREERDREKEERG